MYRSLLATVLAAASLLVSCSSRNKETQSAQQSASSSSIASDYGPRIGIAVSTGSRSCVAIQNAALTPGTSVILVLPVAPQSFIPAQISGPSSSACPITQEVAPGISSYDLQIPSGKLQKLTPVVAVTGNQQMFTMNGDSVQSDLAQNGTHQTYRACSADDGIHLSVWNGAPLVATPVWRGYFFEASNPGIGAQCTPAESQHP